MNQDIEKLAAARAALSFVKDGYAVGLGTGTTSAHFIRLLGERVAAGLKIRAIASSNASTQLAGSLQIPLTTLQETPELDVYVDGADEIDPKLSLIKGGGGALLREKILASAAREFVVIADASKRVPVLGAFPLPVEVIPFAEALITKRVSDLGASVALRKYPYGNPLVTDEGHHILDCRFGKISDPAALARKLSDMPGVVEHGLFIGMADVAVIAGGGLISEVRPAG